MKRLVLFTLSAVALTASPKTLIDNNWYFSQISDTNDVATDWRPIDLPHDWSIDGPYSIDAPAGNDGGYLPTGKGVYRRSIYIPEINPQKVYGLIFEGVYMNAAVKVNGKDVGSQPYGYTTFYCDITPAVTKGDNELIVEVDNSQQKNSRWYTGSGIYRHVWYTERNLTHITDDGVFITTPQVTAKDADINISVDIANRAKADRSIEVNVEVSYGDSVKASTTVDTVTTNGCITRMPITLSIDNPALWSPETPNLYHAKISLSAGDEVIDSVTETFGVRKFEFSADKGLTLNGRPLNLYGGCVHHDNGVLGAKSYDAAEARKVRLMKEAGFNAVRTSHNPPSPAFLNECDRQGLIVIDEIFDGWRSSKTTHDYAEIFDEWWEKDVTAMVKRDRNHPSILAWSIGNEIIERKSQEAVKTAHSLAEQIKKYDPTRPVTSALAAWDDDWEIYDPLAAEHDIVGYNYMIHKSESDHQRVPERVMWQTESYPRDAFSNWCKVNDNTYIIGDFVWTAIDYLGESGIGRHYYDGEVPGEHWERPLWPWHGALCGDIDLTGYRKPISYYRHLLFAPDTAAPLYMAVREPNGYKGEVKETLWGTYPTYESWNWSGHEDKDIDVEIYTRYPKVCLYHNGELVGESQVNRNTQYKATFTLPYQRGTIKAVAYDSDGKETATSEIATASAPHAIRLTADRNNYKADGQDLAYILAEVVDSNGKVVPDAVNTLHFTLSGPGEIIATGSADMKDMTPYPSTTRTASAGRALSVVKINNDKAPIILTVRGDGLATASIAIEFQR